MESRKRTDSALLEPHPEEFDLVLHLYNIANKKLQKSTNKRINSQENSQLTQGSRSSFIKPLASKNINIMKNEAQVLRAQTKQSEGFDFSIDITKNQVKFEGEDFDINPNRRLSITDPAKKRRMFKPQRTINQDKLLKYLPKSKVLDKIGIQSKKYLRLYNNKNNIHDGDRESAVSLLRNLDFHQINKMKHLYPFNRQSKDEPQVDLDKLRLSQLGQLPEIENSKVCRRESIKDRTLEATSLDDFRLHLNHDLVKMRSPYKDYEVDKFYKQERLTNFKKGGASKISRNLANQTIEQCSPYLSASLSNANFVLDARDSPSIFKDQAHNKQRACKQVSPTFRNRNHSINRSMEVLPNAVNSVDFSLQKKRKSLVRQAPSNSSLSNSEVIQKICTKLAIDKRKLSPLFIQNDSPITEYSTSQLERGNNKVKALNKPLQYKGSIRNHNGKSSQVIGLKENHKSISQSSSKKDKHWVGQTSRGGMQRKEVRDKLQGIVSQAQQEIQSGNKHLQQIQSMKHIFDKSSKQIEDIYDNCLTGNYALSQAKQQSQKQLRSIDFAGQTSLLFKDKDNIFGKKAKIWQFNEIIKHDYESQKKDYYLFKKRV